MDVQKIKDTFDATEEPSWVGEGNPKTIEAFDLDQLTDTPDKEERSDVLLNPTKGVKVEIKTAELQDFAEGKIKQLRLQTNLVDGIKVKDKDGAYKNKAIFTKMLVWFDQDHYNKEMSKDKKHTKGYWMKQRMTKWKTLRQACDIEGSSIDTGMFVGKTLIADIAVETDKYADKNTGEQIIKKYNVVTNFKRYDGTL